MLNMYLKIGVVQSFWNCRPQNKSVIVGGIEFCDVHPAIINLMSKTL